MPCVFYTHKCAAKRPWSIMMARESPGARRSCDAPPAVPRPQNPTWPSHLELHLARPPAASPPHPSPPPHPAMLAPPTPSPHTRTRAGPAYPLPTSAAAPVAAAPPPSSSIALFCCLSTFRPGRGSAEAAASRCLSCSIASSFLARFAFDAPLHMPNLSRMPRAQLVVLLDPGGGHAVRAFVHISWSVCE